MVDTQILTQPLRNQKNKNILLRQFCHRLVWHTSSKLLILMSLCSSQRKSDESLLFTAKEATFVYHAAIYGQSFKSSDYNLQASFKKFWT